jgi:hypothetical protein
MRKTAITAALGAAAFALTACAGQGSQAAAAYTEQQAQIFHDYLPYAYAVLVNSKVIYGGVIQPDQFATDARWAELETQAKGLCDDARANGWPNARAELKTSLADAEKSGIETRVYEIPLIAAATTAGSFCPDLAEGALPSA